MKHRFNRALLGGAVAAIAAAGIASWQAQAAESIPISQVSHLHGIGVDMTDPERLYLATHYGVYRTAPDGTAEKISDNEDDYMGFTPHPTDGEIFYASGHPAGGGNMGVKISRDGGKSWEKLADGEGGPVDFHAMDISAADPNVLYGLYGEIQVSRDGGETWEVAGAPPADVFDIAASSVNADMVYAATRNGVMFSRDGGKSWASAGAEGKPVTMVETGPDGRVYAFVIGSGLMTAPATALAWEELSTDFGERMLLHLAVDPADADRMFAVPQEGPILTSTDGGRNWAPFGS